MRYEQNSFPFAKIIWVALLALICVAVWKVWLRDKPITTEAFLFINEREVSRVSMTGKVTVLNFWSTSCPPCMDEMPAFNEIHKKYHTRGVQVIAVALSIDDPRKVGGLAAHNQWLFKVAYDKNNHLVQTWGSKKPITAIPRTFIIDRTGRVVEDFTGGLSAQMLDGIINKYL